MHDCWMAALSFVQVGRCKAACEFAAVKVHAALQEHLNTERSTVTRSSLQLCHTTLYQQLHNIVCCSALGQAAEGECNYREAAVQTSFGRDLCAGPPASQLLSMNLGQVQMMRRANGLQGRRLKQGECW